MIDGIDAEALGKIIGGVIITVILALFGRSVMIRRLSKDGVVVAHDAGHVDVISVLQRERDGHSARADKVAIERDEYMRKYSEAMLEIGGLRRDVDHLSRQVSEQAQSILAQSTTIERLERTIAAQSNQIASLVGLRDVGLPPVPKT